MFPCILDELISRLLNIKCRSKYFSFSALDVIWFKGDQTIFNGDKYWIQRRKDDHFLSIFNTVKDDCGTINVVAFNKTGEVWHSFDLLVKGKLML